MTLTEMRYITALAKEKHFGRAAESCHITQPTLSLALKKVESQLGAALFERSASDVRITPLGERMVVQAARVLEEAVRLEEIAQTLGDPLTGALGIGVIYTVAPYLLPPLIPLLYQRAKKMPLFLKEDFTNNLIIALKSGEIDIAIIALPVEEPGLVTQAIYKEDFRLLIPASHPWQEKAEVESDTLQGQEMLLLGHGNCFRDQVLESCPHVLPQHKAAHSLEGSSLETIRHMVASGAGMAVMPATAADPLIGKENLVKVLRFVQPSPFRTIGLVWRVTFPRPKVIDVLRAALQDTRLPGTHLC